MVLNLVLKHVLSDANLLREVEYQMVPGHAASTMYWRGIRANWRTSRLCAIHLRSDFFT